jgi:hypothetical protein
MSLDGLRAWIGEVERKLGMRTRVFLVLTTIALGASGAAIYLAIDARESSVSESDVRALQEDLETRIDEVAATEPAPPPANQAQPEAEPKGDQKSGSANGADADNGEAGNGTSNGAGGVDAQDLLERAKEQVREATE